MSSESPALPPGVALYQIATGHYFSHALSLAVELRIADLLARGPRDAADLASATETHAPSLRRVLRLLASVGVLEEQADGSFSLTATGELLRSDVPGSMHAMAMLFAGPRVRDAWHELGYCVRTGEPWFRKDHPEMTAFSVFENDPEGAANFDRAMAAFTAQTAVVVAASYDFSAFERIADVGGGNGALLIGILRAHPRLRGIVFDRPDVALRARANIDAAGLSERCETIGGSFFERVPDGADAYLLKHVIHDWNDRDAREILAKVRSSIRPGGKLLVVEGVYPARIQPSPEGRGAAANDVNMLVATGGRQRSEAEFRDLFRAAGFRLARVIPTPARVAVIEGEVA